jgi:ABC-type transport system involved in cytochrome c biogenesis permease subunit
MFDTAANVALATAPVVAGIVWAVRLEGRINVIDKSQTALSDWLERVEAKIDRLVERR